MKKSIKQIMLRGVAITALAAAAVPVYAENDYVVILGRDGTVFEALMTDVSRIDIGDNALLVSKKDGQSSSFAYAEVKRINIGVNSSSIDEITSEGKIAVWPRTVATTLNIAGAEAGSRIAVYSLSGLLLASSTADGETMTLDLSAAPAGVCVVAIGNQTVKIIKK